MGFSLRRRAYVNLSCITLDNSPIQVTDKVRSLGVTIESSIALRSQLSALRIKVTGNRIDISRISRFINQKSRLKLLHNLVLSPVDFCNSQYCELPNKYLRSLQILVNSAARLVKGVSHLSRERVTSLCIELYFLPVKARIKKEICLLAFKAFKNSEFKYIPDLLVMSQSPTNCQIMAVTHILNR